MYVWMYFNDDCEEVYSNKMGFYHHVAHGSWSIPELLKIDINLTRLVSWPSLSGLLASTRSLSMAMIGIFW